MSSNETRRDEPATPSASTRRSHYGREEIFAVLVALLSTRNPSLAGLATALDLSESTVKRILRHLRETNIIDGRLGSVRVNLGRLARKPLDCAAALVMVEVDVKTLRSARSTTAPDAHDDEHELLDSICHVLPLSEYYKGKILVERGHIVMGHVSIGMVVIAHALAQHTLFDFIRLGIEKLHGVERTQTLMIHHSVAPTAEAENGWEEPREA